MCYLITCHGPIMPRLAVLLFSVVLLSREPLNSFNTFLLLRRDSFFEVVLLLKEGLCFQGKPIYSFKSGQHFEKGCF